MTFVLGSNHSIWNRDLEDTFTDVIFENERLKKKNNRRTDILNEVSAIRPDLIFQSNIHTPNLWCAYSIHGIEWGIVLSGRTVEHWYGSKKKKKENLQHDFLSYLYYLWFSLSFVILLLL